MSAPDSRRWTLLGQVAASLVVITLLLRDAQWDAVLAAMRQADWRWLLVATLAKAAGLTLHELRLWVSLLPWHRLPLRGVLAIGYVSGLTNTILPIRGGDLLAAALLRKEHKVAGGTALAAVGITGFLEAAVFAVFVLAVMVLGAARWEQLLGVVATRNAMGTATLLALGSVFGSVVLVLVSRRLSSQGPGPGPGPLALLKDTLVRAGEGLSALKPLLINLALAALQVAVVVLSFWALLPAMGLTPPVPLLAVSGVIAVGSLAAVVLPPSLGAGPAAAAVFVLGFFGVGEAEALGFAALSWTANSVPPLVLGIGPLWSRAGRVRELLEQPSDRPSP